MVECFHDSLFRGDVLYVLYADNPILQTMSDVAVLSKCPQLGGIFDQWPIFLQEMYHSGKGTGIRVIFRYTYEREYNSDGSNYKYVMTEDRGYGFSFDSGEPGSVDISKYHNVGRYKY